MAYHHLALATRDLEATDLFYDRVMGFRLLKVEVAPTPSEGWAKHLFYDTGDGTLLAFWELHDPEIGEDFQTAISDACGLPKWVNHVAFDAPDAAELERRKQRWLDHGYDVLEVDHGWCASVYTVDPNGILVEFCHSRRPLGDADREEALALLRDPRPRPAAAPVPKTHKASGRPLHRRPEARR